MLYWLLVLLVPFLPPRDSSRMLLLRTKIYKNYPLCKSNIATLSVLAWLFWCSSCASDTQEVQPSVSTRLIVLGEQETKNKLTNNNKTKQNQQPDKTHTQKKPTTIINKQKKPTTSKSVHLLKLWKVTWT